MNVTAGLIQHGGLDYAQPAARWRLWEFLSAWVYPGATCGREGGVWTIRRARTDPDIPGSIIIDGEDLPTLYGDLLRTAAEEWLSLTEAEQAQRIADGADIANRRRQVPVTYASEVAP